MNRVGKHAGFGLAVIAQLGAAALVATTGRTRAIPLHFDWAGHVDDWGDRSEVALIILAMAALTALLYLTLPALSRSSHSSTTPKSSSIARSLVTWLFPLTSAFLAAMALGVTPNAGMAIFAFLSGLCLVLGVWLGKVEPNPFVGVRTYWTLRSRLAWDKSNRLFGRIAFWCGLGGVAATPVAPQPLGVQLMIAIILGGVALAVFESWRVWRVDPERLMLNG